MSASLTETLMAQGSWSLDMDWDPQVFAECQNFLHVLLYWGEKQIGPPLVITQRKGTEEGITIGGHNMLWHLGFEGIGPMIRDRRYASGKNKLSNPSFELGAGDFENGGNLFWRTSENSDWRFSTELTARTGIGVAHVIGDPQSNDVLESEERFEARPGDTFRAGCYVKRTSGTKGRIRIRVVFEGRFKHPDLIVNGTFEAGTTGWSNTSEVPSDCAITTDPHNPGETALRVGPTARKTGLANGGFDILPVGGGPPIPSWTAGAGTWALDSVDFIEGLRSVKTEGPGSPALKFLHADLNLMEPGTNAVLVQPNERWIAEVKAKAAVGADGSATLSMPFFPTTFPTTPVQVHDMPEIRPEGPGANNWRHHFEDFTIPQDIYAMGFAIVVLGHTVEKWNFDDVKLTRIRGNFCTFTQAAAFGVTPERTYELLVLLRTGVGFQIGALKAKVHYADAEGKISHEESPDLGTTLNQQMWWRFDFTPPSGTITAIVSFWGYDIEGQSYWIERVLCRDKDKSSSVRETISQLTVSDFAYLGSIADITAPEGTESVRVEVIAEKAGWVVDDVALVWTNQTPVSAQSIVRELLINPYTGQNVGITEGRILNFDVTLKDWTITNLTNREALDELSTGGLVEPAREYRLNPDRTLDWGLPTDIFEDRTDVVLAGKGLELLVTEEPEVEEDASEMVTDLYVEGAERETATGKKFHVIGEAHSTPPANDWNGVPLRRGRVIEDDSDHISAANAKALEELEANNHPAETVRMRLADPTSYFDDPLVPGQYIYVHQPEAGFEDLDNPMEAGGETVFAKQTRVWEQVWNLGPGFRAVLRREDGTEMELPNVRWEDATEVELEVGDRPSEAA